MLHSKRTRIDYDYESVNMSSLVGTCRCWKLEIPSTFQPHPFILGATTMSNKCQVFWNLSQAPPRKTKQKNNFHVQSRIRPAVGHGQDVGSCMESGKGLIRKAGAVDGTSSCRGPTCLGEVPWVSKSPAPKPDYGNKSNSTLVTWEYLSQETSEYLCRMAAWPRARSSKRF